ncbi:MAG: lysylphosphatidylglycerol synthase domain-containing protein [Bacteroidales bacterium]|nr:lysylphosphatidylglycerol synthase domain-containing protein [Bacteroidales bacterium]
MSKHSLQKVAVWTVKILVFAVAWGYVVYKFQDIKADILHIFVDVRFCISILTVLLVLMLCNWGLEVYKWHWLISKITPISWRTALKGVLIGLPLALVTPNRIGEIGGRAVVLAHRRKKAVFATFIGSLSQLCATLLFGLLGFILYMVFLPEHNLITVAAYISVVVVVIGVCCFLLFRKQRWLYTLLLRITGKVWFRKFKNVLQYYPLTSLAPLLGISLLRYAVFCAQFCIAISVFVGELSYLEIFVGVTLTYFFTTIIPTSVLGEIGIRGSVAMFVFGFFTNQEPIVFQVSLLIWLINIVLPTLAGTFLLVLHRKEK